MARRDKWPRRSRTLGGAWLAIEDLRECIDEMRKQDVIEAAVSSALAKNRAHWLTGVRGWVVTGCAIATAFGALATTAHAWVG